MSEPRSVERDSQLHPRYKSPAHAASRMAAQRLLLKPYTWGLVDVTIHGTQNLRGLTTPFIATSNHSSHLDTSLIFCSMPPKFARVMSTGAAADTFFDKKWKAGPMALFFNAFPIERAGKRTESGGKRRGMAGRLLNEGVPLLIFAEGTRSRTGAMSPLNPGIAALSISRSAPIVPIAIVGAYAAWPSSQKKVNPGKPPVHVVFGSPMRATPGEIATEFITRVFTVIRQLHDQTARAYDMPTLDDYARAAALRELEPGRPTNLSTGRSTHLSNGRSTDPERGTSNG